MDKIEEDKEYILNELPGIKQFLKVKIKMQFNKDLLWHVGHKGMMILESRKIKLEPYRDLESLGKDLVSHINLIDDNDLKEELSDRNQLV